jgi:hypothetical protein
MKLSRLFGDCISFATGFTLAPGDNTIKPLMASIMPMISQGAMDEIAKGAAGLLLSIVSRWAFSRMEKFNRRRRERKNLPAGIPLDKVPETLTINQKEPIA